MIAARLRQALSLRSLVQCLVRPIVFQKVSLSSYTRNVGIVAHVDAGKTTTTEHILYLTGKTNSIGRVDRGDTVMDFLPQERERGITISAACISCSWQDHTINIIDTPGHVDFSVEVELATKVLDGCVLIVDATKGVQCQTRSVWRRLSSAQLPAIVFMNKMDRPGADLQVALQSFRDQLPGALPLLTLQLPLTQPDSDDELLGLVDLATCQLIPSTNSTTIDKNYRQDKRVLAARKELLESLAELDEVFMDQYLSCDCPEEQITPDMVITAVRRMTLERKALPVLCGAALKGLGVQAVLDAIIAYLPSPSDRQQILPNNDHTDGSIALVFKNVHQRQGGVMTFLRLFQGSLSMDQSASLSLYNARLGQVVRIQRLFQPDGDTFISVNEAPEGGVVCVTGLKHTRAGDLLLSTTTGKRQHSVAELKKISSEIKPLLSVDIPPPVFSLALEPASAAQLPQLEAALAILTTEDPSLVVAGGKDDINSSDDGQIVLKGLGELHLEVAVDKLRRQHRLTDLMTGRPAVSCRETLSVDTVIEQEVEYDRQVVADGKRLFAAMTLRLESKEDKTAAATFTIHDSVREMLANEQELFALEESLIAALSRGSKGWPLFGMHVDVLSIRRQPTPVTNAGAIRACIAMGMSQVLAQHQIDVQELHPIMLLEVEVPPAFVGEVVNDLAAQRLALHLEVLNNSSENANSSGRQDMIVQILAHVPLHQILGYSTILRSMTKGEGSFTAEYLRHDTI